MRKLGTGQSQTTQSRAKRGVVKCSMCQKNKTLSSFYIEVWPHCEDCFNEFDPDQLHPNLILKQFTQRRAFARKEGISFTLNFADLLIPTHCPILGVKLKHSFGKGSNFDAPSIDRINPALGYVLGNVQIICNLANRMKSNATEDQLRAFACYYSRLLGC